jgi:methyl-accepting chemotaxis protein
MKMIDKRFEHRFALKFIGIFVAFTGIIIVILYFTLTGHEIKSYAESIRLFMESQNAIQSSILTAYLIEIIIASLLVVFIAVFASHKISGPIYRIQTVINGLLTNLHMKPVVLRENDQLEGVASGFNVMLKGLQDRFGAISIAYEELDLKRKRLYSGEQEVKEMSAEMEKLSQAIKQFDV